MKLLLCYHKYLCLKMADIFQILSIIHLTFLNHTGNPFSCLMYYLSSFNTTSWILGLLVTWFIIHCLYCKSLSGFLKRMLFTELNRERLTEASWNFGFCLGIMPLSISKLYSVAHSIDITANKNLHFKELFKEFTSFEAAITPLHVTICFVCICSYLLHQVVYTVSGKGFSIEVPIQTFFCLFFVSSYVLRRFQLGLIMLLLLLVPDILAELTRILYIISRKQKSLVVEYICYTTFMLHTLFWFVILLFIMPNYILWPVTTAKVPAEDLLFMMILVVGLWSFYWLHLWTSPFPLFLRSYLLPLKDSKVQSSRMERILFPLPSDRRELLDVLYRVHRNAKSRCSINSKTPGISSQGGTHGKTFYQTFRCVMALRRKVRRNRQKKEMLAEQEIDCTDTVESSHN